MNPTQVSVLVFEKHPMLREALCAVIESDACLRVAGSFAESSQVLEAAKHSQPGLILFSVGNPDVDDLPVLRALCQAFPSIPVLALLTDEVPGQEQVVLAQGTHMTLSKSASRNELLEALHRAVTQVMEHPPPRLSHKEALRPMTP